MRQAFAMPVAIDAVDPTVVSVKAVAKDHLTDDGLMGLEVAVSEALANIVSHAVGLPDGRTVGIELVTGPEGVTIVIRDEGRPVPYGLFQGTMDIEAIDVMAEDGRGLSLIRHFVDRISYCSEGGSNRLTLVFARGGPQ